MSKVTFRDQQGNDIPPWVMRAGAVISATEYSATTGDLICTVYTPDPAGPKTIEGAMAFIYGQHEQRMKAMED